MYRNEFAPITNPVGNNGQPGNDRWYGRSHDSRQDPQPTAAGRPLFDIAIVVAAVALIFMASAGREDADEAAAANDPAPAAIHVAG